jgi:N-acetylneuraminate synthase
MKTCGPWLKIGAREMGRSKPTYIIAEMSANHKQEYDRAVELILKAKQAGADAIKLQTYTADTITIDSLRPEFVHQEKESLWAGRSLYELYGEAYTPWEWQPRLKAVADEIGIDLFSTPFDDTAVNFLEQMGVPAHKIASFELVDLPLLRKVATTGKPVIMSTGMATLAEIDEAVHTLREGGCRQLALLKCVSAYPAPPEEMNLRTIPHLAEAFDCPVGLSDHTLDLAVPVAAVALGACIIEKHFTLARADGGPDAAFSLEPAEFKAMVEAVRIAEKAVGQVHYGITEHEQSSRVFRRSLFVVKDMKKGEAFTPANVRSIRPGSGLHTRYLPDVLGRHASRDIACGTPLSWACMAG